jgi:hypothetical protein
MCLLYNLTAQGAPPANSTEWGRAREKIEKTWKERERERERERENEKEWEIPNFFMDALTKVQK